MSVSEPKKQAPGELEHVRAFVNTWDPEDGLESLGSPGALAGWLVERGLLAPGGRVTTRDLGRARGLREALRSLLLAHNGSEPDPDAPAVLGEIARAARLEVRFAPDAAALEPAATGPTAALGRLVAIVAGAMADGTWTRLKACRDETCTWAFYDRSKNRSRTWCSMDVCGNRTKVKEYRRRQRGGRASTEP